MEYVRFKDVTLSTQYGYTADETSKTEGTYKYLRITDIVPYFVNFNTVPFCTIPPSKVEQYLVNEGDILIARTGATTGYNYVVQKGVKNTVYASYLIRFNVDKTKVLPSYMKYVLKSNYYYGFINNYIGGSAQPGMNARVFGRFNIPNNSLPIQRRIASILSAYDNLIENNNKRIRLLEQMAENLYKEWFVRFRFPGHEKAEFENGLPKGWKRVKICDVCNVTDGVHNTVIDAPQSKYFLLSSKNIKAGKIVIGDNERTIDEDTFIKLRKRTKMSKGDILLSSVGTIGEVCLLNEEPLYYEFQRSVAIIKPDFSISNSCLLYEMFKVMRNDFVNAAHGAAQQCLFIGDLKKMKICLPSKTISDIFERKVRPIYNMISSISKQNENLSRQRDLLLPRLMSGKLEVK